MVNDKNAFWQALVYTIAILAIGFTIGFFFEGVRSDNLQGIYANSEINLMDEQLRAQIANELNISCSIAIKNEFEFADRIYWEATKLENADYATKFSGSLKILHKRYDQLRTILWLEAINIKKRCNAEFHTLVYIYDYEPKDLNQKALQLSMSKELLDIKNKHSDEVLLIPIAGDMDLESLNLILDSKDINKLPAIIIDENRKFENLETLSEIETIIFESNK
jgi:hypothetical protein